MISVREQVVRLIGGDMTIHNNLQCQSFESQKSDTDSMHVTLRHRVHKFHVPVL